MLHRTMTDSYHHVLILLQPCVCIGNNIFFSILGRKEILEEVPFTKLVPNAPTQGANAIHSMMVHKLFNQ